MTPGLFKKAEPVTTGPNMNDVIQQVGQIDERLKLLEGRYTDVNRKVEVTDKNMLNERKIVTREIRVLDSDMLEIKREINNIKNKIQLIVDELKSCARKEDVITLKKYLDLWEPVNFVTRNELDKVLEEKFQEIR